MTRDAAKEPDMFRTAARSIAAAVLIAFATPAFAAEESKAKPAAIVAPTAAVAAAWAAEERALAPKSGKALNALYASYGVLQGLDAYSTRKAIDNGAREANPMMDHGAARNAATRIVMSAAVIGTTKLIARKNKKAAVVTMVVLNGAMAAVVANNMKNAKR
jgi:hypothetical protein